MGTIPESEHVCAISGRSPAASDLVQDADENDDLDTLPIGWVRVTIERRGVNAAWLALQGTKARTLANLLGQIPEEASTEDTAIMRGDMGLLIDAQFIAIESVTPRYATETVTLFIRNPDEDKGVAEEWGKIADALGFPASVAGE